MSSSPVRANALIMASWSLRRLWRFRLSSLMTRAMRRRWLRCASEFTVCLHE